MSKHTLDLSGEDTRPTKDQTVAFRISDRERAILEALSQLNDVSISTVLRACINGPLLDSLGATDPRIYRLITNEDYEK